MSVRPDHAGDLVCAPFKVLPHHSEEATSMELNGAPESGKLLSFFAAFAQKVSFAFRTSGWRLEIKLVATP